jgi:hypothetical protein
MSEEIDRWIAYMKSHPNTWKQKHTAFINAQFSKSKAFRERLLKLPGGKEKLCKLYDIKNISGFPSLNSISDSNYISTLKQSQKLE